MPLIIQLGIMQREDSKASLFFAHGFQALKEGHNLGLRGVIIG